MYRFNCLNKKLHEFSKVRKQWLFKSTDNNSRVQEFICSYFCLYHPSRCDVTARPKTCIELSLQYTYVYEKCTKTRHSSCKKDLLIERDSNHYTVRVFATNQKSLGLEHIVNETPEHTDVKQTNKNPSTSCRQFHKV